jgi:hypothetical protein
LLFEFLHEKPIKVIISNTITLSFI